MAVDYFLKIDGIKGESHDSKHKGEIDLLNWSWGETQSGSHAFGGGGGAGKVNMQDFAFQMNANIASPKLLLACANGEHIKEATLTCRKAGKDQQEYLKIKMNDLLVSSFQTGGSAGGEVPVDSIAVNYSKIEYSYAQQKPDGSLDGPVKAGYNLKEMKAI
ncbi:MAG: type VI secretion system tube protein Hcp [Thermoanaerobaculia bacterium]|nr:type VI secretion system tube protein Hcp [Thermoanaerobaculia bacterium]